MLYRLSAAEKIALKCRYQDSKPQLFHAQILRKNGSDPFCFITTRQFREIFVPPHGGGMEIFVFEKNLMIGVLLDFYGELLTDRKRLALDMYYNEDLSLAEIASEMGISRQGVRDMIKKAQDELVFYESKLGLAKKFSDTEKEITVLADMLDAIDIPAEIRQQIEKITVILKA